MMFYLFYSLILLFFSAAQFNKKNEEVGGYTKKSKDNVWLYSSKTVQLILEYMEKFPELFDYLSRNNDNASRDMFQVLDIFEKEESLAEISNWLKDLPSVKGPRQTCGTLVLEEEIIAELEKVVDANDPNEGRKQIVMQVRPHLLYKPNLFQGSSMPDDRAKHFLFDRVVNVREGFSVPLGLRGTITGIYGSNPSLPNSEPATFDVLFDEAFPGGLTSGCSIIGRSYRVPSSAIINISFGNKQGMSNQSKPMAVVTPLDQRRTSQSGQLHQQQHHQKQQRHREWDSRLSHATRNETPESGDSHNVLEQSQKTAVLDANSSLISHEKDIVQPQIQLQQPQLGSVPTVRCKARVAPDPEDLPDPSRIFGFYNKEEKELSGGKNVPVTKVNDDSTHNDSKSLHTLWSSMEQKQKLPLPVTGEEQNDIHVLSEKENEDLFSQNLKAMLNISHSSAAGEQRTVENFFITAAAAAASASASPASSPHKVSSQDLDGFKTFLSTHNLGKPRFIYYDGPNASVHAKTSLPWGVLISSPGPAQTKLMAAEMTAKAALKHIQIHGVPEGYCSSKKIPFVPMQVRRKKAAAAAAAASSSSSSSSSAATETTETSVARSTDGQEKSANFKTSHETKQRNLVDFAPHTIQENDDYLSTRVETVHTSRQCIKGKAKKKPKIAANIGL